MLYCCVLVMHNNGFHSMLSYASIKNFDQIPSIFLSVFSTLSCWSPPLPKP